MTKKVKKDEKKVKQECLQCNENLKKYQEMEENWKRSVADFANFKKRSEEERGMIMNVAKAEVVLSFLPVYDSLLRALEMQDVNKDGLEKVLQMFLGLLKNYNIEKIEVENDFDPSVCEAIGFVEGNSDNDGKIAQVVETGFKTEDSVIKPARVMIYKEK